MILDPNDPAIQEYQRNKAKLEAEAKEKDREKERKRAVAYEMREAKLAGKRISTIHANDEARRERNRIRREEASAYTAAQAVEKANLGRLETQRNVRILRDVHGCDQKSTHERLRPLYLNGFRIVDIAVACGIGIRAAQRRIFDKAKPKPNRLLTVPVDLT